ncbi:MAG: hypothetical protein EHM12_13625, partial [Dehalococcoidia bacterium]
MACTSIQSLLQDTEIPAPSPPQILVFSADSNKIENGSMVTLQWDVNNADSVFIDNGVGFVASKGSRQVKPYELTAYNLTAQNASGDVA